MKYNRVIYNLYDPMREIKTHKLPFLKIATFVFAVELHERACHEPPFSALKWLRYRTVFLSIK